MSKNYEAPIEVRELEKAINNFTRKYGLEIKQVFADFLRYIINGYTIPGYPSSDWKYNQEQNKEFHEIHNIWLDVMHKQIRKEGWYDPFGDLFMALTSQHSAQLKGQFFTPTSLCNLSALSMPPEQTRLRLRKYSDHTAGSGRMLLAVNNRYPGNFMVAQDIDHTCCLMTVCNFMINSCVGLVICRDSLTFKDFRGAWLVNEYYYRTELPSIRPLTQQELRVLENSSLWMAYLLDEEGYKQHIHMMNIWSSFMSLFEEPNKNQKSDNE